VFLSACGDTEYDVIQNGLIWTETTGDLLTAEIISPIRVDDEITPQLNAPIMPSPRRYAGFPSLHLVSDYDPFAVERSFWHNGAATLWGADAAYNFNDVAVRIRGRGNSTWVRGSEKRPLRLRFPEARHMFGSEYAHRDWILLANLFDPGILRNHSALYLGGLLSETMDFTPSSQFVHLYVNGEYKGLYELTDERNPEPGRGPLHFNPDPALSEFMFELDGHVEGTWADYNVEDITFFTAGVGEEARSYDIRFPRQRDWDGHLEYLRDFVRNADEIIRSRDFEAIQQVIDIPSMIDFFLVQEFMKNVDVPAFSVFMTLRAQGEERRIFFGPVWDFDRSAGNTLYWTAYTHMLAGWRNHWFRHMLSTPEIFDLVAQRWDEIKDNEIRQMIDHIAYLATEYEASFLRNFERHDHILGGNPPWFVMLPQETREIDTFQGQVEYLLAWFEGRAYWLTIFFERRYDWINEWWDEVVAIETIIPEEPEPRIPHTTRFTTPPGNLFVSNLPSLHLTTYYDPFNVSRAFWHDGTVAVSGSALSILNFDPVDASFRGRGNSTWAQGGQKRPLRLRFAEAQPLLGSGYAATDWILLADFFDRSLFRNYTALYLGNLLSGLSFTPTPRHVHLYVNEEYMGVYLLTDERDVNPGRMQLVWDEDPGKSDFFLELDARASQGGVTNDTYVNVNGLLYDIRYPNNRRRRTPEHVAYVYDYLHRVSYAIRRQSFEEITALIDLDSFIDFYLVHEWMKEFDVFSQLSIFMYIRGQGDDRRLFMGPVWDFDLAAGNSFTQPMGYGPEDLYVALFNYWYRHLMLLPEFFDAVVARWNEIVDREIAQTMEHVRLIARHLEADFDRNFERHPILGVVVPRTRTPEGIVEIESFIGQVEHLLDWLETRTRWMDDFFNGRMPDYDPLWALVEHHTYRAPIDISVDGEVLDLDFAPINLQNRIMFPIQGVAELLGLESIYNAETGIFALHGEDILMIHRAGDLYFTVNWERLYFDAPGSLIIGGYLYVPLRVIAELLDFDIYWGFTTRRIVMLTSPQYRAMNHISRDLRPIHEMDSPY